MNQQALKTVGETLIDLLEANNVDVVFGIPGVHTAELYRGLANSKIRHITPRHEQSAGFMADGYARVSGKPGICFVITGPGITNIITAMAQALADSVPMLVISGVNARPTLGKGYGELHELPNQQAMIKSMAVNSRTLLEPTDLGKFIEKAFNQLASTRPGPVHIEIPIDVMSQLIPTPPTINSIPAFPRASVTTIVQAAKMCTAASNPVILAGGGATAAAIELAELATCIDAPVVTTVNGRGLLAGHPLRVPASPSLAAVRTLLSASDLVLAIGTQIGSTDYDMYKDGQLPALKNLIRVDIDYDQLARGPEAVLSLLSTAKAACSDLIDALPQNLKKRGGKARAAETREAALNSLSPKVRNQIGLINTIRQSLPGCIMVGDSTQLIYAGNLFCDIDRVNGWFNAATGFGALGYSLPAAIGANIAAPDSPVVCIVGDGGIQFTMAELGTAVDEKTSVIFVVWNNEGYQEIETYMTDNNIAPIGVRPTPPDFLVLAEAYRIRAKRLAPISELGEILKEAITLKQPFLLEIQET